MDMRYANINELLQSDEGSKDFFNALPKDVQKALLQRGNGINNFDELTRFADVVSKRGFKDTSNRME